MMLWRSANHPPLKITLYTIFILIMHDGTDGLPKPHARNGSELSSDNLKLPERYTNNNNRKKQKPKINMAAVNINK